MRNVEVERRMDAGFWEMGDEGRCWREVEVHGASLQDAGTSTANTPDGVRGWYEMSRWDRGHAAGRHGNGWGGAGGEVWVGRFGWGGG